MNIEGENITPAQGKLAVEFLDDDEDEKDEANENGGYAAVPGPPCEYEGCLAIVKAVGPPNQKGDKVYKPGNIVVTSPWARDGLKIGKLTLISAWDVQATLKTTA